MPDWVKPDVVRAANEFIAAWRTVEQGLGRFNLHQHHDAVVRLEVATKRLGALVPEDEHEDDRDDDDDDDDRDSFAYGPRRKHRRIMPGQR